MTIQAVTRATCNRCGEVEEVATHPERVGETPPKWSSFRLLLHRDKSDESHEIDLCSKCTKEIAAWAKMKFRKE